jgi:hypothetical protein
MDSIMEKETTQLDDKKEEGWKYDKERLLLASNSSLGFVGVSIALSLVLVGIKTKSNLAIICSCSLSFAIPLLILNALMLRNLLHEKFNRPVDSPIHSSYLTTAHICQSAGYSLAGLSIILFFFILHWLAGVFITISSMICGFYFFLSATFVQERRPWC